MRFEPLLARPANAFLRDVEADQRRGHLAKPLVQPATALELVLHPPLVDEANVDDAPAFCKLREHLLTVEGAFPRQFPPPLGAKRSPCFVRHEVGRAGLEPAALRLKVPCSAS